MHVNLVDIVKSFAKNRRRYSRERASPSSEVIQCIHSFASGGTATPGTGTPGTATPGKGRKGRAGGTKDTIE